MYSSYLSPSLCTHSPNTPSLQRLSASKIQYQPLSLDKTFSLRTDSNGDDKLALQGCKGLIPLPRDGRIYPGVIQDLRDNGCEMLVSVDYQRNDVPHLKSVMLNLYANIRHFRIHGVDPKKLCVLLFCDGFKALQKTFASSEDDMLFLQQFIDLPAITEKFNCLDIENVLQHELPSTNLDPEIAHCFQSLVVPDENVHEAMQLVCVVKHNGRRKHNSRLWFFKGFCETIKPNYCSVINAGILPEQDSLWQMYCSFKPSIGVIAGEILPDKSEIGSVYGAAFAFKQTISLKLDRFLEGTVGVPCTSNLPFVTFRYEAIKGVPLKQTITDLYSPTKFNPYNYNKFECGDSLLALTAVSQKNSPFSFHYEKEAKAKVLVPTDLLTYLHHRRTTKRTEMYMFFEAIRQWKKSNHTDNPIKRLLHGFLILYFSLKFCCVWCASALSIAILNFPITEMLKSKGLEFVGEYVSIVQCIAVLCVLVISLSNQSLNLEILYKFFYVFFTFHFIVACLCFVLCYCLLGLMSTELVLLCLWLANQLISAVLTRDLALLPWFSLQNFSMIPTEAHLVNVSMFSNLHNFYYSDWLSKTVSHRASNNDEFQLYRTYIVLCWAISNWFVYLVLRKGNQILDGGMISTRLVWYACLGILVGLDFFRLLISSKQLFAKKPNFNKMESSLCDKPGILVSISQSSGHELDMKSELIIDLMDSSASRSENMAAELASDSDIDLSIKSIDFEGDYFEENVYNKTISGISTLIKGPPSRFISSTSSAKG